MTTKSYIVRGSHIVNGSAGHTSIEDACDAVESQFRARGRTCVSVEWPDGSVGYYRDQEDAGRDQTAIRRVSTRSPSRRRRTRTSASTGRGADAPCPPACPSQRVERRAWGSSEGG